MGITTEGYVCASFHLKDIVSSRLPVKTISSSSYTWHPQIVTDVMPDHFSAKFSASFCLLPSHSPRSLFLNFFYYRFACAVSIANRRGDRGFSHYLFGLWVCVLSLTLFVHFLCFSYVGVMKTSVLTVLLKLGSMPVCLHKLIQNLM